jgi:hypothetical protein
MWSSSWRIPNGFISNNFKFHPKLKAVEVVSLKYILRTNLCSHCMCFLSLLFAFFFLGVNHYLELKFWYPRDKTHLVSKGQSLGFNYLKQRIMQKYEKQRALKLRLPMRDFVLFYA